MPQSTLALVSLGRGEIILILVLLLMLTIPVALIASLIFLVVRANKQKRDLSPGEMPPQIPPGRP